MRSLPIFMSWRSGNEIGTSFQFGAALHLKRRARPRKRRAYPLQQALHMCLTAVWVCLILCKADERLTANVSAGPV